MSVSCGKANINVVCSRCKYYSGTGSGTVVCNFAFCFCGYKFSVINYIKDINMNLNPIKAYKQHKENKLEEAINKINQDENFKFLLEQYNQSLRFTYSLFQVVLKTSIQDYYKKRYKILFKEYDEIKFEKEIISNDWLLNVKTDKVH